MLLAGVARDCRFFCGCAGMSRFAGSGDVGVAVVTGAGRRIGRELALGMARRGLGIVVHHRGSIAAAAGLVDEIRGTGGAAVAVQADFEDPESAAATVFRAAAELGEVRVLLNSAAIFEDRSLAELDAAHCNQHLSVNLLAPLFLAQQFERQLRSDSVGHIINLLDWRALRPGAAWLVYTAAKAGLAAATKTLAQQLAPRIQVNAVAPGAILPPQDRPGWHAERALLRIPLQRTGAPADLLRAVDYLLDSPFVTGEILHVSGGEEL